MGPLSFLKRNKKIKGYIRYYSLEDWWNNEFSEEEQKYMIEKYQPMGSSGDLLTTLDFGSIDDSMNSGDQSIEEHSDVKFLTILSGWFNNKNDLHLAEIIINKANKLSESFDNSSSKNCKNILDEHFLQSQNIETYYKKREIPAFMDKTIEACKKQIAIADEAVKAFKEEYNDDFLPSHKGYKQLAIIYEKQKKYEAAIALCKKAKEQGWMGDWEKRIERCTKKLNK